MIKPNREPIIQKTADRFWDIYMVEQLAIDECMTKACKEHGATRDEMCLYLYGPGWEAEVKR